jgi:hypothetical protein
MLRTLLGNIVHGFRRDPVKTSASLLALFQTHPVVIYQLVVLVRFPTLASAAMLVLGALANHLLVNLFFQLKAARTGLLVQGENAGAFRDFSVRTVPAENYLQGPDFADMDLWLVKRLFGPTASLNDTVKTHVRRKPGTVVANLTSYSFPLFGTHIFLTDEPGSVRGIRRFQVLHEIGHGLTRFMASSAFVELGTVPFLFFLVWFASTVPWTIHALTGAVAFCAAVLVWRTEIQRVRQGARLRAEIIADGFAVGYLSPEDCREAAASRLFHLLKDRDLSELYNAVRLAGLREMLRLAAAGETDKVLELGFTDLPPLGETVLASILLEAVLAAYASPPTTRTVLWAGIVGILLLIAFLFAAFLQVGVQRALERELEQRSLAAS